MGIPMRYSRSFIIVFVALGLVVLPAPRARADDDSTLTDALEEVETMTAIAREASLGADLARWGGLVEALGRTTGVDHSEAEQLLASVTDLILVIAEAGERAGVLTMPDVDDLFDMVLAYAASADVGAGMASAKAAYLTERAVEAIQRVREAERRAMVVLADAEAPAFAAPIDRWRPMVEKYFTPDLVGQAMSIIQCESNGDPDARNRRSGSAGLFQFIRRTWATASVQAGFSGASPYEPEANIAAAAWLVGYSLDAGDSAWAHWTCRP